MDSSYLKRLFPGEPSAAAVESLFMGCEPWPEESGTSTVEETVEEVTEVTTQATATTKATTEDIPAPKKKKVSIPCDTKTITSQVLFD